jgi:DNA-binding FadR family transcriptional regulator
MPWVSRAARAPGKALHVALAIWHQKSLRRGGIVTINLSGLEEFGLSRDAARRGLQALEQEGLVSVHRVQGRKASVTVLPLDMEERNR